MKTLLAIPEGYKYIKFDYPKECHSALQAILRQAKLLKDIPNGHELETYGIEKA